MLLILHHHGHTGWALVPGSVRPRVERVDLRNLVLRWTRVAIRIDLADLTMTLRDGTQVLASWPVAAGRPQSPTPTGTFSVTDRIVFPDGGPYGTSRSAFRRGRRTACRRLVGRRPDRDPRHRPPLPIGTYASLGCIRVVGSGAARAAPGGAAGRAGPIRA